MQLYQTLQLIHLCLLWTCSRVLDLRAHACHSSYWETEAGWSCMLKARLEFKVSLSNWDPERLGGGSYVRNTSLTCVRPRSILKTGKEFKFQGSVFQTFRITYAKGGSKKWDQTLTDTESTFRKCPNKSHNQAVPEGSPWAVSLWHSTASSPQTPRDESMVYLSYHWLKVWFLSLELNIGLDTNFYWWIFF